MSLEACQVGIVEDDLIMGESLVQRLTLEGATTCWWKSKREALEGLARCRPNVVICDIRLPDGTGEELFVAASESDGPPPFLFMTAHAEIDQAVRLMRAGAGDYVTKPFEMSAFLERLQRITRPDRPGPSGVLGVSRAMKNLEQILSRLARSDAPVLLTGETGSGKEVCARHLHALRGAGPFIGVNCAAIPAELMESELFGHEKGAFTGAQSRHLGYAERAGSGTLFLDEIGDLQPRLQAKLLRLLEDRSFTRVGGEQSIPFTAKVVCATNADLAERVQAGGFREDLLYRINVVALHVPPLRERPDDIPWLLERLFQASVEGQDSQLRGIAASAVEACLRHAWRGNVRELRNRVERAIALGEGPLVTAGDLFPERNLKPDPVGHESLDEVRDEAERRHILKTLAENGGAVQATARALDISRTTLWEKMRRLGLSSSNEKA